MYPIDEGMLPNTPCTCPPSKSVSASASPIRHVHQIDTGHHLEQLASHMNRASVAAGPHVDLGRISPGIGDELGNGLGRNGWVDQHHIGRAKQSRDWRDVANEIEIKLFVERRVDRV